MLPTLPAAALAALFFLTLIAVSSTACAVFVWLALLTYLLLHVFPMQDMAATLLILTSVAALFACYWILRSARTLMLVLIAWRVIPPGLG